MIVTSFRIELSHARKTNPCLEKSRNKLQINKKSRWTILENLVSFPVRAKRS